MSFSTEVKQEILKNTFRNGFCVNAALFGISIFTVNEQGMATLKADSAPASAFVKKTLEKADVNFETNAAKTVFTFNTNLIAGGFEQSNATISRAVYDSANCMRDMLISIFMLCGTVSNPEKIYALEFITQSAAVNNALYAFLDENLYRPLKGRRKNYHVLYYKNSEHIENILTLLGAPTAAIEVMNSKILKDIRNNANRIANCETANIDKTVNATSKYITAIKNLDYSGRLQLLDDGLKEVAALRTNNPLISLKELGELVAPPLSKSGVKHRLDKLVELASKGAEK